MSGTSYGYVRVSTGRQDMGRDAQRRALETAGCTEIIEEQASGRKARLAPGDVVTVFRFDRISRSVADFYAIGERIGARGASLRNVAEQSTPRHRRTGAYNRAFQRSPVRRESVRNADGDLAHPLH